MPRPHEPVRDGDDVNPHELARRAAAVQRAVRRADTRRVGVEGPARVLALRVRGRRRRLGGGEQRRSKRSIPPPRQDQRSRKDDRLRATENGRQHASGCLARARRKCVDLPRKGRRFCPIRVALGVAACAPPARGWSGSRCGHTDVQGADMHDRPLHCVHHLLLTLLALAQGCTPGATPDTAASSPPPAAPDPLVFDTWVPGPCSPNGQPQGQCPPGELFRVRLVPWPKGSRARATSRSRRTAIY